MILAAAGIKAFGPSKGRRAARRLEGFTKELCVEANIPTAAFAHFDNRDAALAYVREKGAPIVIKADGLAAGKGVIMAETLEAAVAGIEACFDGAFGAAGASVVIEEWLDGEEASFFALCDGEHVVPLASAQDHKRAFDGDEGPNTGGMGAYSPAPVMTPEMTRRTMDEIILPTRRGDARTRYAVSGRALRRADDHRRRAEADRIQRALRRSGMSGADAASANRPARGAACHGGRASERNRARLARRSGAHRRDGGEGLSRRLREGSEIKGLRCRHMPRASPSSTPARVAMASRLLANGGRVLNVTALGTTIAEAKARAYAAVTAVDWPGGFCRSDIGWRAIERG